MSTRVFDRIDDPFLESEWKRLEKEGDVFPQSSYHWCATWWKHLSGGRKLHVIMALGDDGNALAIAPLCIERHFGIRVLRSFPIHFGDFYTFISGAKGSTSSDIEAILGHIHSNRSWSWVRLEQVVESGEFAEILETQNYVKKKMTACPIARFSGCNWDQYLGRLSSSFRSTIRRKIKSVSRQLDLQFVQLRRWTDFEPHLADMFMVHQKRWSDDTGPSKSESEKIVWTEAIREQFNSGRAVFFALKAENTLIAYRLGFFHGKTYYDWHLSHNPDYGQYSPGIVLLGFVIQYLMKSGYHQINFMAGEYDWKMHWATSNHAEVNYMFSSPSQNVAALLLNWYHHRLRNRLKAAYHHMMRSGVLRIVSRNTIGFRQKMAGQR